MTTQQVQAVVPLRIKRLTLTDFRAFPGPAPAHFDFDGKNLLVYGENGAGKSSLFHALAGFFSVKHSRNLRSHKNVFSGEPETGCAVNVEFNDAAAEARWFLQVTPGAFSASGFQSSAFQTTSIRERHPAVISGGNDARVIQAALRRACLDYRSLLDTNYRHGNGTVNLFDIALDQLLTDYPVPVAGGLTRTIGELWQVVEQAKPLKHGPRTLARVNQACVDFNNAFSQALTTLQPLVGSLLGELIGSDVTVAPFTFGGVTYTAAYYKSARVFAGRVLTLDVSYRTHQLATPQHFLNEARLSALGLAIYLAGRLACTPTGSNALKLLVLDDVLIGLDHSNRLPVVEMLRSRFGDWQIALLTHDRNWFDMARSMVDEGAWKCIEIFEGDKDAPAPMPIVRPASDRPGKQYLQHAKDLLALRYIEAAANYARQALEATLRGGLELKSVKVMYKRNPKELKLEELLTALEGWAKEDAARSTKFMPIINRVRLLKNVVMNPYSHPDAPNIPEREVREAIDAVDALIKEIGKK